LNEAEKLEEKGQYQEAIPLLDKAIENDPEYLGAYINRGADKSALGDYQEAIKDYQKVIELDSNNTLALFNIGNNYKRLEDYSTAIKYYNKAFETKGGGQLYLDYTPNDFVDLSTFDVPGHEIAYERGLAYYDLDSLQLSANDMQVCIQKNYMIKESHYMIGACYFKAGQMEQACKEFEIAANMGDKDAQDMIRDNCDKVKNE
jgi:tetratricopeptide (TPR) repeat protein